MPDDIASQRGGHWAGGLDVRGQRALPAVDDGDLAYLTRRAAEGAADRGERAELGVIGHGPGAAMLTERVAEAIHVWGRTYRLRDVRFEIRADRQDSSGPREGRFFLDRPHHPLTVIWQ